MKSAWQKSANELKKRDVLLSHCALVSGKGFSWKQWICSSTNYSIILKYYTNKWNCGTHFTDNYRQWMLKRGFSDEALVVAYQTFRYQHERIMGGILGDATLYPRPPPPPKKKNTDDLTYI